MANEFNNIFVNVGPSLADLIALLLHSLSSTSSRKASSHLQTAASYF